MRISLLIAAIVAQPALGANVTFTFSGKISSMTYADCQTFANGNCTAWNFSSISSTDFIPESSISLGQSFYGSFKYDSNSPMSAVSSDGFQGIYFNAPKSSSFNASSFKLPSAALDSSGGGNISVVNGRDGYDALLIQDFYSNADFFVSMYTFQQDRSGTVFQSFALPTNLSMSSFNYNGFSFGFLRRFDGDQVQISGTLSSISIATPVPELPTGALLATGVLLMALRRVAANKTQV